MELLEDRDLLPKIAMIVWEDSVMVRSAVVWRPRADVCREARLGYQMHFTVGFVLEETEHYYLITHSVRSDLLTTDSVAVPKSAVLHYYDDADGRKIDFAEFLKRERQDDDG